MSEYIDKQAFISQTEDNYCKNCTHRKDDKGKFVYEIGGVRCRACDIGDMKNAVDDFPAADVASVVHAQWSKIDPSGLIRCTRCGVSSGYVKKKIICFTALI